MQEIGTISIAAKELSKLLIFCLTRVVLLLLLVALLYCFTVLKSLREFLLTVKEGSGAAWEKIVHASDLVSRTLQS